MDDIEEIKKIRPWNSTENPIKINTIRYNQDFSLLTLGTSKGYRVFLTSTLKLAHEETEANYNFGDIFAAMTYYKSSLVFLLPTRYNNNYSNKELIIFDDFYQTKLASFKDKNEGFTDFFLSKNILFLVSLSKIIVVELFSFKVIEIIEKINNNSKLISFNFQDFIAYTYLENKKDVYIQNYKNLNYKIVSKMNKVINSSFDFIQIIEISPLGDYVGIVSIFGNKIHIYNTQTGKLKECIFLGPTVLTLERMAFSEKKPNYIFLVKNDNKMYIYKIGKVENPKCVCSKYNDKNMISGDESQKGNNDGFFGFIRKSFKNKDIKDIHAFSEYKVKLIFADFNRNKHKEFIIINHTGIFNKFHFNKKRTGKLSPDMTIQWV